MLNQVIIIGRTTKDVELKEATNGRSFGIATIAVTRAFKDSKTNEYGTDFIDITLWGGTAENFAKHAGKGSAVSIRGRIANRTLDFPDEKQTIKTLKIVGEQVSFIQTKPPAS